MKINESRIVKCLNSVVDEAERFSHEEAERFIY